MKPCRCYLQTRLWQLRIMSLKVVLILFCLALVSKLYYNLPFQNMIVYYYYLLMYYDSFNISNSFYYLVSFNFLMQLLWLLWNTRKTKVDQYARPKAAWLFFVRFLTVHCFTCLFACLLFYWFVYLVGFLILLFNLHL